MNKEIYRNRVPAYNAQSQNIIAERTVNVGKPLLDSPTAYTVAIESATIDLSKAVLDPRPGYKVMVWCDLKPESSPPTPDGMVYGANLYTFPGELTELKQFTQWLDDILLKKALPFNLGHFELNSEELFRYTIQPADKTAAFDSGYFQVYFNEELCRILEGFYSSASQEVYQDEIFYPLTPQSATADVDTVYRLNKIESLLITTTLPVTDTQVLNVRENQMIPYNLLGSVEINNLTYSIRTKSDWRYLPNLLRHYTLTQLSPITQYNVGVMVQYNDSSIRQHVLGPRERFIVNLAFFPRGSVEE